MRAGLGAFVLALVAEAHVTLWHPALFGFNYPDLGGAAKQNYDTNAPVSPLRGRENRTIDEWFGHGYRNLTPADGEFLELKSGSTVTFELSCNRAYTTYRPPHWPLDTNPIPDMACPGADGVKVLHNANKADTPYDQLNKTLFGGSALAIAYTSDVNALKPSDMTVISVNGTSPWLRLTDYAIPEGLPPCPKGGCLCTWNWVHTTRQKEGYPEEIYNTLYRCKVTGKTNKHAEVPKGSPALDDCMDEPGLCTPGAKQPLYMFMKEGNNVPVDKDKEVPNYRSRFADGAQTDVVSGASLSAAPALSVVVFGAASAVFALL